MMKSDKIYPSYYNPYLFETDRPMPDEMAVIGAGHIGPDIAYYLRTGLPDKKLYLVDKAIINIAPQAFGLGLALINAKT